MVKIKALEEVLTTLNEIKESGLSIAEYFNYDEKEAKSFYNKVNHAINTETQSENKELQAKIKSDYAELKKSNSKNYLDNDTKTETDFIRDMNGKITGYYFKVYRRDKTPVTGTLTRDEMNMIHRLYSYYGSSITGLELPKSDIDTLIYYKLKDKSKSIDKIVFGFQLYQLLQIEKERKNMVNLSIEKTSYV